MKTPESSICFNHKKSIFGGSMSRSFLIFLLPAIMVFAVSANSALAAHHELKEAIEAQNTNLSDALNSGDAAQVAALYTSDAVVMPPGSPKVTGRAAIQVLFQGLIDSGVNSAKLTTEHVESSGNLASEIGSGVFGMKDGTYSPPVKYVVVWKQNDDGVWQLHADIWNSVPGAD